MENSNPTKNEIQEISKILAAPMNKIGNWFKYERKKRLNQNKNV